MWPFTKEYKVTYWATNIFTKKSIFTIVKATSFANAIKKIEKKHYSYTVGIISIEEVK